MALRFNLRDFNRRTRRLEVRVKDSLARSALRETAEEILKESKSITPVDTGKLRSSLKVLGEGRSRGEVTITLGSEVDYAFFVHEDLQAKHDNGQSKFLTKPLNRAARKLTANLASKLRRLRP